MESFSDDYLGHIYILKYFTGVCITTHTVPVFNFTQETFRVNESDKEITVTIELIQGELAIPIDIIIDDATPFGPSLSDYVPFSTILTFLPGSTPGTQQSFNITLIDDTLQEPDETIVILGRINQVGVFPSNLNISLITILVMDGEWAHSIYIGK